MRTDDETLSLVGNAFRLPGRFHAAEEFTRGNINGSYKVAYREEGGLRFYVFQRLNTSVFQNPREVMENIELVTAYIEAHSKEIGTLHFHHTEEGKNYAVLDSGFWRVMDFIDSVTFDKTEDLSVIRATGQAFGRFQTALSGLPGDRLHETIPDFHNTKKRFETLFFAALRDERGRRKEVEEELRYLKQAEEKAGRLSVRYEAGEFPVRVTHNDTKCNNVLFDRETKEPLAVIDLDTVMPGMAMCDFGDGIRFIAATAAEDDPDPSRISLDMDKFRAFTGGFLGEVGELLTEEEIGAMPLGAFSMTAELAARFLSDYLCGDTYFKTLYPTHNLVRARGQIALAKSMEEHFDEMTDIVRNWRKL